jgi:hypothetical protein
MRHPNAIIDPSFAICAEHVDPVKALHRSRASLLYRHKRNRTISQGKISGDGLLISQDGEARRPSTIADSTTDLIGRTSSYGTSAGNGQSLSSSSSKAGDAEIPSRTEDITTVSPGFQYTGDELLDHEERRRSNIFRKLMNKNSKGGS